MHVERGRPRGQIAGAPQARGVRAGSWRRPPEDGVGGISVGTEKSRPWGCSLQQRHWVNLWLWQRRESSRSVHKGSEVAEPITWGTLGQQVGQGWKVAGSGPGYGGGWPRPGAVLTALVLSFHCFLLWRIQQFL